ncbi:MAG: polysaccharide deacetylase family protein [Bacteroidales bacterium]|nr:polysaccharide deacetylase family protein [Bacteroidales bacterium]
MRSKDNKTNITILYYHSVANHQKKSNWSFLSTPIKVFQSQIDYLVKHQFYACSWNELYEHTQGIKKLPNKTVMFHFDDGFLDNWSVVFPIMKKAGFKYSVLLTPEFIQEGEVRPFVAETNESNKSAWWGYLNKKEIRKMSESGLVDFAAHGYTHTWFESSDKLIDIYDGTNFYPHLSWNLFPEKKPYWLIEEFTAPLGYPVFEYKKSLELKKRFIPDRAFIDEIVDLFSSVKDKHEIMKRAKMILGKYKSENKHGRYETLEEKEMRIKRELLLSKEILEDIIGKPINYFVFPGGGSSKEVLKLCREFGFKLVSGCRGGNRFNSKIYQVDRYSGTYTFPLFKSFLNKMFLKLQLLRSRENQIVLLLYKFLRR